MKREVEHWWMDTYMEELKYWEEAQSHELDELIRYKI
jgi:hypothetical protein